MRTPTVALIGLGPRGLTVLERIVAQALHHPDSPLEVLLFDPRLPGAGVHDVHQPAHLLVNTVASQITQFTDESVREAGPLLMGPSFQEWLCEREPPGDGAPIDPNGYYSRAQFGRYLNWVFEHLLALAPPHLRISHRTVAVERITPGSDTTWRLHTADGSAPCEVDFVFLTTGHSRQALAPRDHELLARVAAARTHNRHLRLVLDPYPVRRALESVTAGQTVAIEGAGLTACDVISELTAGRGGRFDRQKGRLVYLPSGAEPRLLLLSRSGLPLTARGVNQKGAEGQYRARFLTVDRVRQLRGQTAGGQLDFERDVLPLLLLDMQHAYDLALLRPRLGLTRALRFSNEFVAARDPRAREALVDEWIAPAERFSWHRLCQPIPAAALADRRAFGDWLLNFLRDDLRMAGEGNVNNPVKAACDVLRDVRDTLRAVIDHAGLTEASHRWVLGKFVPVMNRLAVGPPKLRIEEWLALNEAGVLQFDFGPGAGWSLDAPGGRFVVHSPQFGGDPVPADVLVRARIAMPGPADDLSPLMVNLLRDGLVRPFRNGGFHPGGLEVDRQLRVVNRDGQAQPGFWALGTPTEGCKFYTFVVPRPGVNSTALVDAGRIVARLFETVVQQTASHRATGGEVPPAIRVVVPSVLTFHGRSPEISTCETLSVF
jgi:uncharacterized NAD(P)/FAD-binding protein YdhS